MKIQRKTGFMLMALATFLSPVLAQDPMDRPVMAGQEMKISGVIIERTPDLLVLQNLDGREMRVRIAATTEIEEKKKNFFRGAINYRSEDLVRGLRVFVEGRTDSSGVLVAREIKFTQNDLKVAEVIDSSLLPVEGRMREMDERAGVLSGQVEELNGVSRENRSNIRLAQERADEAHNRIDSAEQRIDAAEEGIDEAKEGVATVSRRLAALGDYDLAETLTLTFRGGSSQLSADSKQRLDQLVNWISDRKGVLLEVTGFASSDGSLAVNRRLSQQRAEAVQRYLTEKHQLPLRIFVSPYGFGELRPVADNSSLDGRSQNRRVEVKVLVNRGLSESTPVEQ